MMEEGKVGTGGRWVRGKGGDGEGEGTENEEKNSGQEGKFSKTLRHPYAYFPFFGWYDIFTLPTPCVRYPSALRYCGVVTSPKGRPYGWLPNMVPC